MSIFSIKHESKAIKITVAVVLILFFSACVATSFFYGDELLKGSFERFDNDDVKYIRSAKTLLETGMFTYRYVDQPTVYIMPGYVCFILPFVKLFGMVDSVMWIRLFQAILQTIALYIFFLIGRRIYGTKFAITVLICMAIYVPNIYVTAVVFTEGPFLFFFGLLTLFIMYSVDEKKTKYYITSGLLWGICTLLRPACATLPIVVIAFWYGRNRSFKYIGKYIVVACLSFIVVLSPWWIRNLQTFGEFIPLTQSAGNPMMQGAFYNGIIDQDVLDQIDRSDLIYSADERQLDTTETLTARRVFAYNLKQNPLMYAFWYTCVKTFDNFKFPFILYPLYGKLYVDFTVPHFGYLLFALLGLITWKRMPKLGGYGWLLLGMVIYFNCIHLPFYCYSRYVYPVMPFVIMGAVLYIIELNKKRLHQNLRKG